MLRILVLLAGTIVSLSGAASHAQEAVLGQLYGSGVHAYFAGDYFKAHDQFTSAVNSGSRDPRVYYYRGLSYLKLGREAEATQDFQKGAELESKDLHRSYNVARSLERIQGTARQQLETYRVKARMVALEEASKIRKARFEAIQREEQRVLRAQTVPAPAAPAEPVAASEAQAEPKAADTDPFGNPAEPKEAAPPTEEKATEPVAETPAESPAEPPAAPPAEPPAAPPAEPPEDPFGGGNTAEEPAKEQEKPAEMIPEEPAVQQPAVEAQPPAESTTEKPAESKAAPPKKSILSALFKSGESSLKKSVGGVGSLLPKGMGVPGMKAPGAAAAPAVPGSTPAGDDPFGSGTEMPAAPPAPPSPEPPAAEPKSADDPFATPAEEPKATPPAPPAAGEPKESPFQEEPAPADKPAEEKPAGEKPAEEKPADEKPAESDPFA